MNLNNQELIRGYTVSKIINLIQLLCVERDYQNRA